MDKRSGSVHSRQDSSSHLTKGWGMQPVLCRVVYTKNRNNAEQESQCCLSRLLLDNPSYVSSPEGGCIAEVSDASFCSHFSPVNVSRCNDTSAWPRVVDLGEKTKRHSRCAARVVPITRKAIYSAAGVIHVVAAHTSRAPVERALRASRIEHRGAIGLGAIVPHPVRQARARAVRVMACPCSATIARA